MHFSTKRIVLYGLMIALSIVLAYATFYVTPFLKISLKDIPIVMASIYGGPVIGMLCGIVADIISAQGWLPQLAIAPLVMGMLPSLLLRLLRKNHARYTFLQLLTVLFLTNLIGPILITTCFLSDLYGIPVWSLLMVRAPQYAVMSVVESVILVKLLPLLDAEQPKTKRMTYDEAIAYIHAIYWKGSKMGLSRTRELLSLLGNPEKKLKFIHVGGTNGKGSTCAMLASVLRDAGYRVGLYTSPYITRFNERMQVNGRAIADRKLARIVSEVRPYAESMRDLPTEFELITAIAMQYFLLEKCDIVVLEVGLGGEFDSTNVIDTPVAAVITAMGYDHTAILGDTMAQIARAKAGIIKEGGDVVIYGGNAEADAVFADVCIQKHARLMVTDFSTLRLESYWLHGQVFDYLLFRDLKLKLLGAYQTRNAALAINVLALLKQKGYAITDTNIRHGLMHTDWPGRFELLHEDPTIIVDGGHNPHGVAGTVQSLQRLFPDRKIMFVIGVMADKDLNGMLGMLLPLALRFYAVTPENARAMPAEELASRICAQGGDAVACQSVCAGMQQAISLASKKDVICAVGSLYMAGEIREFVKERKPWRNT